MQGEQGQLYLSAKRIALAAFEHGSDERMAFVASACAGDESLRAEVTWMLGAAEITGDPEFMPVERPLPDMAGASITAAAPSNYRVISRLGEGGMGVVYLAERGVGGEQQRVALKFLHGAGWADPAVRQRFAEERRILATLNHPNIAHLVDGGDTADGRPYLALEYVEGQRIDHWCEQRKLPLRERLALFLKVCAAVQYAHSHLVIHRDIKPSNILVNTEGEPKLLDFGIARLLDHVGGTAAAQTVTMQRALTLAYSSPEQVRGESLGTAADVWSLGVVLYQLVCGVRPFEPASELSSLDLSNAIVTGNFRAPSWQWRRLQPDAGRLPADIDAIVLKALRQDPAQRYASVQELAQDLGCFFSSHPVRARQGHRWYRARLFVKRNRLALSAATIGLLLVSFFIVELEAQLHRVQTERDKTQAIAGFMSELFENADPTHARGDRITVREVLDHGAAKLRARADIEPSVKAALLLSIGVSYIALDQGDKAVQVLLLAKELQLRSDASILERGRVMAALGRAYGLQTELHSAMEADRAAIDLLRKASGDHVGDLFTSRIHLLFEQVSAGAIPADESIRQLQQIVTELDMQKPALPEAQVQALTTLSVALGTAGDYRQAVDVASKGLAIAEHFYGPGDPALLHPRFILALATAHTDPASAVNMYAQIIDYRQRVLGDKGAGVATLYGYRGFTLSMLGRHQEASEALSQALAIARAEPAPRPDFENNLMTVLANEYLELGRDADAANLLQGVLEGFAERTASGSAWARANQAAALNVLATVAMHAGHFDRAQQLYAQMHGLTGSDPKDLPDAWTTTLNGEGLLQVAQHRYDEAQKTLVNLDAFNRETKASADSAGVLNARLLQARLAYAQHEYVQASGIAEAALSVAQTRHDDCDRLARDLHDVWSASRRARGLTESAQQCRSVANHQPVVEAARKAVSGAHDD